MSLASSFTRHSHILRSHLPLTEEQIMTAAPSIFAEDKHASRSARYTHIPTIEVVRGLRREGFQPFMVCQSRVRDEGKREHAKHMLRLRHASQIDSKEANEIILLNSHDGTSSYQMLSGMFRFVCKNGMVCGDTLSDIRVPHKGNIVHEVIEGAFRVVDTFEQVNYQKEGMKSLSVNEGEATAFARAALALRYDAAEKTAPITEADILAPRRTEDRRSTDLWTTFNVVQENLVRGGLRGRSAAGKEIRTREVRGIDQNVKLNRALWVLAEEMRKLKG
jgi:hypothetical protein